MFNTVFLNQCNFKIKQSKLESLIGSIWKVQTKKVIIEYLTKNLSPPTIFKQLF